MLDSLCSHTLHCKLFATHVQVKRKTFLSWSDTNFMVLFHLGYDNHLNKLDIGILFWILGLQQQLRPFPCNKCQKKLEILVAYALIHDEYKTIMLKRPLVRGQKFRPMQTNQIPKIIFFSQNQKEVPGFNGMLCRNNFNLHSHNLSSSTKRKYVCVYLTYQCEAQNELGPRELYSRSKTS